MFAWLLSQSVIFGSIKSNVYTNLFFDMDEMHDGGNR